MDIISQLINGETTIIVIILGILEILWIAYRAYRKKRMIQKSKEQLLYDKITNWGFIVAIVLVLGYSTFRIITSLIK